MTRVFKGLLYRFRERSVHVNSLVARVPLLAIIFTTPGAIHDNFGC